MRRLLECEKDIWMREGYLDVRRIFGCEKDIWMREGRRHPLRFFLSGSGGLLDI